MQCSKETIAHLFYNASSSFQLLFLFFYLTSILLSKFLIFISAIPFLPRNDEEYEYATYSEEEEEEENNNGYYYEESMENDHLVADIIGGGEELSFLPSSRRSSRHNSRVFDEEIVYDEPQEPEPKPELLSFLGRSTRHNSRVLDNEEVSYENPQELEPEPEPEHIEKELRGEESLDESDRSSFYSFSEEDNNEGWVEEEEENENVPPLTARKKSACTSFRYDASTPAITTRAKSACTSFRYVGDEPSLRVTKKIAFVLDDEKLEERYRETGKKIESNLTQVDKFLNLAPLNSEAKKFQLEEKDKEEIFGDTNTVGSTSKSSSEWRSSINCKDPAYDPFSSSSRRSCPKWESYTVFQKYDEEMLFLDRISVQKLHETESFRSAETCRSSISEKIIHKLASRNRKSSYIYQNPYHELEAAYVAQICLTWEALNWNYKYFHELRAARKETDPGCPAYVAQQFQQFQVLLQRYIENEPYEYGKRPLVYARMRSLAPKLLQVPEYRDSDDEKRDDYLGSRISSDSFLVIMEEAIRTFMNFLKADKEDRCHIFTSLFRIKSRRTSVDPTLLLLLKKVNHKKKLKLKELRRSHKCLRKRRSKQENEMEILLALIDLKVVSRVLRMADLSEEQMHWCQDKMTKVKVFDGKLQRDSSPLFFPAH